MCSTRVFFLSLFSCNFEDKLSQHFHIICFLCMFWIHQVRILVFDKLLKCPVGRLVPHSLVLFDLENLKFRYLDKRPCMYLIFSQVTLTILVNEYVSPFVFLFVWACLLQALACQVMPPFPIILLPVFKYCYFDSLEWK